MNFITTSIPLRYLQFYNTATSIFCIFCEHARGVCWGFGSNTIGFHLENYLQYEGLSRVSVMECWYTGVHCYPAWQHFSSTISQTLNLATGGLLGCRYCGGENLVHVQCVFCFFSTYLALRPWSGSTLPSVWRRPLESHACCHARKTWREFSFETRTRNLRCWEK